MGAEGGAGVKHIEGNTQLPSHGPGVLHAIWRSVILPAPVDQRAIKHLQHNAH